MLERVSILASGHRAIGYRVPYTQAMLAASPEERRRRRWYWIIQAMLVGLFVLVFRYWPVLGSAALIPMLLLPPLHLGWTVWGIGWIRNARTTQAAAAMQEQLAARAPARWQKLAFLSLLLVTNCWAPVGELIDGRDVGAAVFHLVFAVGSALLMYVIGRRVGEYFHEMAIQQTNR